MIYTHRNARGATVIDADAGERIGLACEVDTSDGTVTEFVATESGALQLHPHLPEVLRHEIHFDFVHAIFAGCTTPQLFLCYGRKGAPA